MSEVISMVTTLASGVTVSVTFTPKDGGFTWSVDRPFHQLTDEDKKEIETKIEEVIV
jgi:hypothetical protein